MTGAIKSAREVGQITMNQCHCSSGKARIIRMGKIKASEILAELGLILARSKQLLILGVVRYLLSVKINAVFCNKLFLSRATRSLLVP